MLSTAFRIATLAPAFTRYRSWHPIVIPPAAQRILPTPNPRFSASYLISPGGTIFPWQGDEKLEESNGRRLTPINAD